VAGRKYCWLPLLGRSAPGSTDCSLQQQQQQQQQQRKHCKYEQHLACKASKQHCVLRFASARYQWYNHSDM
jgi:hypothetical protein